MRASRLVNLLLLLQARGGQTAAELARELEVSVRTVHRDVEGLSAAGVPIFAERGPSGGIRLVDGYRTRLTGMTAAEAEALFLSGLPGPAAQLGLGTVVAAAQLKVLAALPPELRSRASRLVQRFHLDPAGWYQIDEAVPELATLASAVWSGRRVVIGYERSAGRVERVIGPLGLVLKAGVWYVVAEIDGQIRTYRGSRVASATITEAPVQRPADFDLANYWAETSAAYERDTPTVVVEIRVRADQLWRVDDVFGSGSVAAARSADDPEMAGWRRLTMTVPYPDEAPGRMLSVGPHLEVLEPPEVRRQIAVLAHRIAERYRDADPVDKGR